MAEKKNASRGDAAPSALSRTIYEGLCDEITSGKLRPGAVLSRRTIATRYGTSYIPVIEAMTRLENAGLIEAEARQAARVRKITLETIQEDYVLREAFETQAIRLCCVTASGDEIDELYRLAEAVDVRSPAGDSAKAADKRGVLLHWQFHKRIAEISRCRVLVRELERIELLRRLQANWYYAAESPDVPRCHSLLVDAIKHRKPTAADAAMRLHVQRGLEKELRGYRTKMDM